MEELKDCPFCGHKLKDFPAVMIMQKRRINPNDIYVYCIGCGSSGPSGWSEKEAIRKWNKRAK